MNFTLVENVVALLDYSKVPQDLKSRAAYLATECGATPEEMEAFLAGLAPLSKGLVQKIADKFDVDLVWLTKGP